MVSGSARKMAVIFELCQIYNELSLSKLRFPLFSCYTTKEFKNLSERALDLLHKSSDEVKKSITKANSN